MVVRKIIPKSGKKRRNVRTAVHSNMKKWMSEEDVEYDFIKEKLFIIKEFISEEEMEKVEEELMKKVEGVTMGRYGKYA